MYVMCVCMLSRFSSPTRCNPVNCYPSRLLCPWDSPGQNTGAGCHFLLQWIFPTQAPCQCLLNWQEGSSALVLPGKPIMYIIPLQKGSGVISLEAFDKAE